MRVSIHSCLVVKPSCFETVSEAKTVAWPETSFVGGGASKSIKFVV